MDVEGSDSDSDQELHPISDQTASLTFDYEDPLLVTGVLRAVVEGNLDKVKALILEGKSPNINDNNGNTPLHIAVSKNQPEIVDYLVSLEETFINSRNFCGETALFQAVKQRNLHIVEKLIKANCNVNLPDLQEITPLHLSVDDPEMAHALIQNGANLNAVDYSGETPLHQAVNRSCLETVCMLLYFNADANIDCHGNITPFMKSIWQEKLEIQQILLDYVVDFNTTMRDGMTLLSLALRHDSPYLETIINRGADVNYEHKRLNAFQMCLRSPNVDKFRLVWKNFKYQQGDDHYLNLLFVSLNESMLCQYLRVIIDSDNLEPIFERFDLTYYCTLITRRLHRGVWFNIIYELVFLYLCRGYILADTIIQVLYDLFGYNDLFYICLHMDIEYTHERVSLDYVLCNPAVPIEHIKFNLCEAYPNDEINFFLTHMRIGGDYYPVPSLLELARNATRDSLVRKFKLFKPKQYFPFINKMPVPKVIKDYLTFRKSIRVLKTE